MFPHCCSSEETTNIVAEDHANVRLCAGVDWATKDHAVCILGPEGKTLQRFMNKHARAGLRDMVSRMLRADVSDVGIEHPDGPVVEALLQADLVVLVISPAQVKNLRSRYGPAGKKDDRFDAYVLADVVRTDRRRLRTLQRDTSTTTALRSAVRSRRDLAAPRVTVAHQLRAHLQVVFPAVTPLFVDVDSDISLQFLDRFNTQAHTDWFQRLTKWLSSVGYSGRTDPEVLHTWIITAPRGATGPEAGTHASITGSYVVVLRTLKAQIAHLADTVAGQPAIHPDTAIFTSLPRSGSVQAARLLAETGDARGRIPTADPRAYLAVVAPSTRQSGKVKAVTSRWVAANKELRDALCEFAGDSRQANPWAADLYAKCIARGQNHPHAVRILGRA